MGIPAYFSHIIKNHSKCIYKHNNSFRFDNLYLDCNSIIYDVVYNIMKSKDDCSNNIIIKEVCVKIKNYIEMIQPTKNVMIAFDGVAPVAKLEQQRSRRTRSVFTNAVQNQFDKTIINSFDTTMITPGTKFMHELGNGIYTYFKSPQLFHVENIIVSTSNEPGEGEHKIFDYIRRNKMTHHDQHSVIYGLDADLIMLSINHIPITPNLYLFRETPEFIKSIDHSLSPNELYMIHISELTNAIVLEMNNYTSCSTTLKSLRVYDYIFMCFFLGNDFMPHFPSINIRTGGIDVLIQTYQHVFSKTDDVMYDGNNIQWKNVRKFIEQLSLQEENRLQDDSKKRAKFEKRHYPTNTLKEKMDKFNNIPTFERSKEKYIDPYSKDWQARYYATLFDVEINEARKNQICINYLEALEWTTKYYSSGCVDWKWKYNYNYAPLLEDLITYVPYFPTEFIQPKEALPIKELTQLCYVLPSSCHYLLPPKIQNMIKMKYSKNYPVNLEFEWSFCRYFWESHIHLPRIDIEQLEKEIISMNLDKTN